MNYLIYRQRNENKIIYNYTEKYLCSCNLAEHIINNKRKYEAIDSKNKKFEISNKRKSTWWAFY